MFLRFKKPEQINKKELTFADLTPNGLYKIFLNKELNKDKMVFYWNFLLNPLDGPQISKYLYWMTKEQNGGETFYLKNGSNVIFLDNWKPFGIFYSLDKQKILFRPHMKFVYFNEV